MATLETVGKVPALVRGRARKQVMVVIDTFVDCSVRHCSKYNDQFTYSSPWFHKEIRPTYTHGTDEKTEAQGKPSP